jgi:predicted alpha/beta-hydrolase family hydrolase
MAGTERTSIESASGALSALWYAPDDAVAALVLAHGAGAGMLHANMEAIAAAFGRRGIATLRFNFPFVEAGSKRPDSPAVAAAAVAAAYAAARARTALPVWLGGHSFGGRMASHAVLEHALAPAGLVFCSFPLHPADRPAVTRAAHLAALRQPLLFLSGTRDALATAPLLTSVVAALPQAQLHWLATADHGYRVQKRARDGAENVFDEMARVGRAFVDRHSGSSA